MLSLLGNNLFPADNPWNQKITNAPVAADSAAIMNSIIGSYGNGRLHPDFGQDYRTSTDLYGIPYNVVHGNSLPKVHVVIDAYPSESDLQDAPIPAGAVIEGDLQNGPVVGVDNRGDSHLIVCDVDNNVAYEFYRASRPSENADGQWHADQETVWNMNTNEFRTLGWTSADAAGLAILPGLVRPDEALPVSQGGQGVINHAIRFTLQNAVILNQFLYPASHTANPGNNNPALEPPMGARFRLKTSVDISTLNPESQIIAQAMKDYGMIVADNGSNFFFSGSSYSVDASNGYALTWNDNDIQDSVHGLKSLTFSDFEVVNLTPAVTGLSAHSGAAGTSITITGRNFSGAAGNLNVRFGNTAATSVTVVDDSHLTVFAPAGTGTVDVRVQSGVNVAANPQNYEGNVFGYGLSATSTADLFSYGGLAPVVMSVSPASGPATGGTSVTITGTGLANATGVYFGSVGATIITDLATQIVVTSPAGAGTVNVTVVTAGGTSTTSSADSFTYNATSSGWTIAGVGDFNGDGKGDVLWENTTTGQVGAWITGSAGVTWMNLGVAPLNAGWTIAGVGDFNGDRKADVLWENTSTGVVGAWITGGGWLGLGTAPLNAGWTIAGAADFNGDGKADVLWKNRNSGMVGVWITGGGWLGLGTAPLNAGWTIAAAADFNGDRKADVLWENTTTGQVGAWITGGGWLGLGVAPLNAGWTIAAAADFNGDGKADVLWENTNTGQVGTWVTGSAGVTWMNLGVAPLNAGWTIAGVGDFNGDGKGDVLWENANTGLIGVWITGGGWLGLGAV